MDTTVSSPSLDNIRLGFRHIITALSICLATIPDGFNDNFVVFTHDDIQFSCQGVSENKTNTCDSEEKCLNPNFFDRTDMSAGQKTYVSEYSLVCEDRHYANLAVSLMFFGVLSTSPFNYVSDLYGRKRIMLISCISQGIFVLLASFSKWHIVYGVSLYLNGFFGGLKYKAAAVLISESVTVNHRDNAGTFLMIGFCAGYGTA